MPYRLRYDIISSNSAFWKTNGLKVFPKTTKIPKVFQKLVSSLAWLDAPFREESECGLRFNF